jgi:chromosomal replication initiation ATPase DnaA
VLIDDVQFLARRPEEQAELLRFASELKESNTQLVLTSDRPPTEIADLDDRLIERLAGGLVVDIAEPQFETRLAILKRRAEDRGVELGRDVLAVVAEYDTKNVRELLGVLNRVIAFQAVSENELSADAARALLEGGEPRTKGEDATRAVSAAEIDEFGAFLHGVEATLTEQVEAWKSHLRDAIRLWSAKGYRTSTLEGMLAGEEPVNTDQAVRAYEAQVERLQTAEREIKGFDAVLAENPVFRDPDRVAEAEALVERTKEGFTAPPGPSEAFSLDEFLVGNATKMALGAARSIVEAPGEQYNPLVIVGPSGVGKTHLLHAIGRAL